VTPSLSTPSPTHLCQIRLWLSISEGRKALQQAVTLKRVSKRDSSPIDRSLHLLDLQLAVAEDLELREELKKSLVPRALLPS
jgi:hypothetical protein